MSSLLSEAPHYCLLQACSDTALSDLLLSVQTPLAIRQCGVPPPVLGPGRGHVCQLVLLSEQDALVLVSHPHHFRDTFADEVEHLADAHEDTKSTGHHHEKHEDLLLGRAADEAVNSVGTRFQGALRKPTGEESKYFDLKRESHWIFYGHICFSRLTWADHIRDRSGIGCRGSRHQSRP